MQQHRNAALHDFHVHVGERIAGYQLRDGFADLNRVPGLAGIGAFVTEEAEHSLATKLQSMRQDAAANFAGKVFWHLTPLQTGIEELRQILAPDTDLKFYTTYKAAGLYRSYEELERWMLELSDLKPRMLVHCEDNETIEEYSGKNPFHSPHDHCLRRPEIAENKAVEKVLDLAIKHLYPVHIVHVSSPRSALLIHEARNHNPFITCETAPHYLLCNEERLTGKDAHRWICSPPFRSEKSRGELVELLQDGCFDIIATDHCAFSLEDKDRYKDVPERVPCGIAGLGCLWDSLYDGLVKTGKISLDSLISLVSLTPARLMNQYDKEMC
ncbi:MAG TPA: dihydroorotase family protein [Candidatus Cloacimonadota bacterium]|nr:dihydroorotase family protein [Candidatus Cloacimonadota bacterium]